MATATRGAVIAEVVDEMTFPDFFIFPTIPWGWEQAKEMGWVPVGWRLLEAGKEIFELRSNGPFDFAQGRLTGAAVPT